MEVNYGTIKNIMEVIKANKNKISKISMWG